jgi:hypothetical protein
VARALRLDLRGVVDDQSGLLCLLGVAAAAWPSSRDTIQIMAVLLRFLTNAGGNRPGVDPG